MSRKTKTYEPKEYVWTLTIDGQDRLWKCRVEDTHCVTFEGDTQCKRLKIVDQRRSPRVTQIDTVTKVYGRMVPFQLRNGVPYLQWEGRWQMSQTTYRDRLEDTVKMSKRNALMEVLCGAGLCLAAVVNFLVTGSFGSWWMVAVFGVFFLISAGLRMLRLRYELEELEKKERLAREADHAPDGEEA